MFFSARLHLVRESVKMAAAAVQDEVDVCESWEDMDEISLEHHIKLNSDCEPVRSSVGCKVTVEDNACIGSQCVMPEPAIRILKRPPAASGQQNGEARARPVKTLEQRQKEYQEARLRILGEARSPEDVIDDNLTRIQDKLQANTTECQSSAKTKNDAKGRERKVLARLPPGSTTTGVFPSPPPRGVLVIRTPRGPDGSKGFQQRLFWKMSLLKYSQISECYQWLNAVLYRIWLRHLVAFTEERSAIQNCVINAVDVFGKLSLEQPNVSNLRYHFMLTGSLS